MMMALWSVMGMTNIHQMNGLKNFFALCINGVAALYFIFAHMVEWPYVLIMAIGAIAGGVGGAAVRLASFGSPAGAFLECAADLEGGER